MGIYIYIYIYIYIFFKEPLDFKAFGYVSMLIFIASFVLIQLFCSH